MLKLLIKFLFKMPGIMHLVPLFARSVIKRGMLRIFVSSGSHNKSKGVRLIQRRLSQNVPAHFRFLVPLKRQQGMGCGSNRLIAILQMTFVILYSRT